MLDGLGWLGWLEERWWLGLKVFCGRRICKVVLWNYDLLRLH